MESLELNLNESFFDQPLVKKTLFNAIKSHFLKFYKPQKALVLSFHGTSNLEKKLISKFIAESLFSNGCKSKYYKHFTSTKDFPNNEKLSEYKVNRYIFILFFLIVSLNRLKMLILPVLQSKPIYFYFIFLNCLFKSIKNAYFTGLIDIVRLF